MNFLTNARMDDGCNSGTLATVILGFREDDEQLFARELRGRMDSGIGDFLSTQADYLLLAGGPTPEQPTPESTAMGIYAVGRGIPEDEIFNEADSESTIENALYVWELLQKEEELSIDAIRISTSEWHSKRAVFVFEQVFRGEGVDIQKGVCFQSDHPEAAKEGDKLEDHEEFFEQFGKTANPYDIAQEIDVELTVGRHTSLFQN